MATYANDINCAQPSATSSQWSILAGTRFVLALCVVITHSGIVAPNYFLWNHFGETGYPAVFGFFMVSGYSIAASIISRPDGYFLRRIRRIYPTYLLALAFSTIILWRIPLTLPMGQVLGTYDWKVLLGNVFMLQGVFVTWITGDGPVWSISVEWWCYMLAILLIRYSVKWTTALIAASFTALMLLMFYRGYPLDNPSMPMGANFFILAWAWMTGFSFYREPTKVNFSIMLLLPIMMFGLNHQVWTCASMIVGSTAVIIYLSRDVVIKSNAFRRILQWLGNMSYPLYLFHSPLLYVISAKGLIKDGDLLIAAVVCIVSIGYLIGCRMMDAIENRFRAKANLTEATSSQVA